MPRSQWLSLILLSLGSLQTLSAPAHAQEPYGLTQRPVAVPFLNNQLPQAEASTTGWSAADAFPSLSFDNPTFIVGQPRSTKLCVGTQQGLIHTFEDSPSATTKTLFFDLSAVTQGAYDSGMMGFVFHPDFGLATSPNRGFIYISYSYSPSPTTDVNAPSDTPSYNRLSRFTVPDGTSAADPNSEQVLINQFDRHLWHNGGGMFFGTDGFLYLTTGDEGGYGNPYNQGQRTNGGLFGGVLRIDVDRNSSRSHPIRRQPLSGSTPPTGWPASYTQNYFIPNDNPWLNASGTVLEEYFALGFRSPHRMTYDASTDRIWLGDVGQSTREEVNIIEKGGNYQWGFREGTIDGPTARPTTVIGTEKPPVFDYEHANGYTAVIGGYVYRGTEHAAHLSGKYLFGDNGTSRIRAMTYDGTSPPQVIELCTLPNGGSETTGMSTFGLNHDSEPLMCCVGIGVKIYKLAKASTSADPPALLSQTGAFSNLATLTPASSLIPYSVNAPLWSDNAAKFRWMSIPNDGTPYDANETIDFSDTGAWSFPIGTVFVKHFELPTNDTNPTVRKRLETRFLVHATNGSYYGLTYKWRADNSDADLLPGSFNEDISITTATGTRTQTWSYPSRQDCIVCHNTSAGSVLGARTCQLNGNLTYPATGTTDNQLRSLNHINLFTTALNEADIPSLPLSASIKNTSAPLELRVRSYLDANCSHCHRPNGVRANFDARFETPLAFQGLIRGPVSDTLGIPGAKLIVPSNLSRSMIRHRDGLLGSNQMPPLARNVVDTDYISVLSDWINSMPPDFSLPIFIGSKSEGTTTDTITDGSGAFINANRFTATNNGSLTEIHAKVGAITGSYRCALYSDDNGNAKSLLRATATLTNVSAGWQTFTLTTPYSINAGTDYWLAIWSDDPNARVHTDTGGNLRWAKYTFGNWPATIDLTGSSNSTYSIYASGPGADGSSFTPTRGIVSGNYQWQAPSTLTSAKFTAKGLPPGLRIHPVTGAVTGTPNSSGTFTVKITETLGRTVTTETYTLIIDAFPSALTGNYAALIDRESTVNNTLGGYLFLTVSKSGALTGSLQNGTTTSTLKGRLTTSPDSDPTYTTTIGSLSLNLTFARSTAALTGTTTLNAATATVTGRHQGYLLPGRLDGKSTTLNVALKPTAPALGDVNQPQGSGWLRLTYTQSTARITTTGRLADGSSLTLSSLVGNDFSIPLRSLLHSKKGSLQGAPILTQPAYLLWPDHIDLTLSGTLDWRKLAPANRSDRSYPTINETLSVTGHRFTLTPGLTALGNASVPNNAQINFTEAGIAAANQGPNASQTFQLTTTHRTLFGSATTNPCTTTLTLNPSTGTFRGTFNLKDGTTTRTVSYQGILVQQLGHGYFTLPQLPLTTTTPILSGQVELNVSPTP